MYSFGETDEISASGLNYDDGDGIIEEYLYTTTTDFHNDVPFYDRRAFARLLAYKTSDMVKGEIRTIYIYSTSNVYVFRADGYMHGKMIQSYNEYDEISMEETRNEYIQIKQDAKTAGLWTKYARSEHRRRSGDNSVFERRSRPIAADRLSNESSKRNATRDTQREREITYSAEEIEKLGRELKEKFGVSDE